MLRIHLKMGPARNKEWTCCFGLHVRTATIMIGMWHLMLNVLTLGILAAIIRNPAMMQELENGNDDYGRFGGEVLPTPLSKIDPPYAYRDHSLNYQNVDMGGIVCVCMIAISLMLIYGAAKYKPSHLLPFFCLQLFDFAITTLTAAGYLCYLRSIHRIIDESHRLPWRDELLKMSPQLLSVVVLLVFLTVVMLKAYAIGIVWRCYKYLTMRQHNMRSMLPYIIPEISARQERDYNTLLPDYEEAIAQSMKQPPPPYCQVAMTPNPISIPNAISSTNATENAIIVSSGAHTIPSNCDEVRNKIPPAYDDANNATLASEITRPVPCTTNDNAPSTSLTSSSSAIDSNASPGERQPNH